MASVTSHVLTFMPASTAPSFQERLTKQIADSLLGALREGPRSRQEFFALTGANA